MVFPAAGGGYGGWADMRNLAFQVLRGRWLMVFATFILMSVSVRNKLGFIDGSLDPPAKTDSLFSPWSKCDTIVLSWLLNSLSPKIAQSVIYVDSSRAMWLELKEIFSQGNGPRIFELQTAISALRQDQSDVSTYFIELKSYVMTFLMGLTDAFDAVRG
ncbi:hypothetical protein F2P56_008186 [Juglans regia]|uniref:Uncharacterized protein LOC108989968 n=2 Tax=Juglans regia TaxID=51240 RepID=A0A2I4EIS7_JUGRE|nr:uncharacterized protein LOC108989968 [Juglans regia]KAF5471378.1 hypothetical protein F2P56_008186 [Juglans regia]